MQKTTRGLVQWKMSSGIGPLYLVASAKGLRGVYLKKPVCPTAASLHGRGVGIRALARAQAQLKEYFRGKRKRFSLPLDAEGTPFQRAVWKQLSRIPYGRTLSCRDVARRIDNPRAVRAVGSANGANPLCIVVPCHRVIAADGSLGGYSGGISIKKKLLKLELSGSL